MAKKKVDLSGVKDFLFKYGERVALFSCIALALVLVIWGITGAAGPGTATGDPWDKTLAKAATSLKAKIPDASEENVDQKTIIANTKFQPVEWRRFDSSASPGPYQTNGELNNNLMRGSPTIYGVLTGDGNWQMDLMRRGHLGYEVRQGTVLAVGQAGGEAGGDPKPAAPGGIKGPAGGVGMPAAQGGGGTNVGGANLATVLKPSAGAGAERFMVVVTGIFPMKKQIDEYVTQLRVRDVNELVAHKELPQVLGINVFRVERGPDGEKTHKEEGVPLIFYDFRNPGKVYVDPVLNKELSESIFDTANPKQIRPLVHEGLVTPLPKLPDGEKYPELRISSDFWPKKEDLVAAAPDGEPGAGKTAGPGGQVPTMPKGSGSGNPPSILGGKKDPKNPMGNNEKPEAGPDVPTHPVSLKKVVEKADKELYERLANGNFNIFHPYGQFPEAAGGKEGAAAQNVERFTFGAVETAGGNTGVPSGTNMPTMPGGSGKPPAVGNFPKQGSGGPDKLQPSTPATDGSAIHDKIVRFVDVDVKPGHSYQYFVKVRVANPNYGKANDVAQRIFADPKELVSDGDWAATPVFKVPGTFHLFAVDQNQVDNLPGMEKKKKVESLPHDFAPFQLHRWVGQGGTPTEPVLIGDWAVAERLLVHKGNFIGGSEVLVEIPVWNKGKGAFEMRQETVRSSKKAEIKPGVFVDFEKRVLWPDGKRYDLAPMLVDFEGGKVEAGRRNSRYPTVPQIIIEDAAMDVLILTPDGRLIARNTRADIDAEFDEGSAQEGESRMTRQKRVIEARRRGQESTPGAGATSGPGGSGVAPILPK